jgi:hypothetical protein
MTAHLCYKLLSHLAEHRTVCFRDFLESDELANHDRDYKCIVNIDKQGSMPIAISQSAR